MNLRRFWLVRKKKIFGGFERRSARNLFFICWELLRYVFRKKNWGILDNSFVFAIFNP